MYCKNILLGLALTTVSVISSEDYYSKLDSLSLESLASVKIYTADRALTSVSETSSIVTVITAKEIKKQGLKTLEEVLERVPGMFLDFKNRVQPFIYHRGIQQDQNTGLLLLVDGVSQNSQVAYGFDAQHTLPHLFNVKQIEIIRGSSSTLWGSNAATSVINIITYSGSDLDTVKKDNGVFRVAYNHQNRDRSNSIDVLWAKKFEDGDIMASYSFSKSKGELQNYRLINNTVGYTAWDTNKGSHNLSLQSNYKNFKFLLRHLKYTHPDSQDFIPNTETVNPDDINSDRTRKLTTIHIEHKQRINNELSLDTNIGYADNALNKTNPGVLGNNQRHVEGTNEFSEKNKYIEGILKYNMKNWKNMIGFKLIKRDLYIKKNQGQDVNHKKDTIIAGFAQSSYSGIKDLKIVAGIRVSESQLRSNGKEVMPKLSFLYNISDKWHTKYVFSTGFIHAPLVYNNGFDGWEYSAANNKYIQGTKLPQKVKTNEIEIAYNDDKLHSSLTLFHVEIKNQFNWIGKTISTNPTYEYTYINTELVKSIGIEADFKYRYSEDLSLYGNFTYQDSYFGSEYAVNSGGLRDSIYEVNDEVPSVPNTMYNFGINYDLTKDSTLNVHYRGYNGLYVKKIHYGVQSFVDVNYRYNNIFMKDLDFSLYGKNIFDNTKLNDRDVFSMTEAGADFGFSLEYTF